MGVLAGMMSGILAAVSQREFWSESQLKELVRKKNVEARQHYDRTVYADPGSQPGDLRAMQVFASGRQQTWLLADAWKAYCVLDDRKWEEPRIQWRTKLTSAQPVHVDEN
jgi:hypothetical protein